MGLTSNVACEDSSSQVKNMSRSRMCYSEAGGSCLLKLMWSLPLCLSSPLDSGTALSIIYWHTAFARVINDPYTHILTYFTSGDVDTALMYLFLFFFCFSHCRFCGGPTKTVRLSLSGTNTHPSWASLQPFFHRLLSQWNSDHDTLLILFQFPWKQETDHAHWGSVSEHLRRKTSAVIISEHFYQQSTTKWLRSTLLGGKLRSYFTSTL